MIRYENDCVGCEVCGFCGRDKTPYLYCDNCKECEEELYEFDGEELCIECIKERLVKVDVE